MTDPISPPSSLASLSLSLSLSLFFSLLQHCLLCFSITYILLVYSTV